MLASTPPIPVAKVLLVDDSPANLLALEAILLELGAQLVRAGSGGEALARTLSEDFAAILLDVHMPDMDGFEAARLIRSRARSRETPILFVTASDSPEPYLEEAYALGAVDFLTKPLHPAVLKGKVSFFIALHRSREELREAERTAVNERAFLSAVLDAVQDSIVACDAQGRLTLFNRATRELHRLAPEAIAPDDWAEHYGLLAPGGREPLAPEDTPLMRALSGEQVRDAEMVVRAPDGRLRTLLASGQPLYDNSGRGKLGAVVSMHDITAEREAAVTRELVVREQARREAAEAAAQRLRQSEERYRTLFDTMEEGFCIIEVLFDEEGRAQDCVYLEANPTFSRHTGLRNVVGRRMREMVSHPDPAWLDAYGQVARTGQPQRLLHQLPGPDRWFDVSITRVGNATHPRVALLGSEVTEQVRAQAALRRVASELAESDQRKTEFLATLAHELRNPLAPLRNGLHLLRHQRDPQASARTWAMMDRQLGHMVRLIDDLMDIGRVSTGKLDLKRRRVLLRELVDNALESTQAAIEHAHHALSIELPDEPLYLDVDATRIEQVISNLLSNAAKYTPAHGHITLGARAEASEVHLWVQDDGMGIDPGDEARIFQMFTQLRPHQQDMPAGLGIGLALVRAITELHGGTISVHSAGRGAGSRFTVVLPLEAGSGQAGKHAGPGGAAPGEATVRVLVVDDNHDAAETLAMILQMDGHVARVAHEGRAALQLAREFDPQVVFLDIGMPGMDGYEVARAMRRQASDGRCPVLVALTGWGAKDDVALAKAAGFDHHLTKPADVAAVEQLLAHVTAQP
ncbi:response regulator [Ramlibacter rhizophilus]|uniref:histidine kinase n=1 Tax=Ramlibacter rhizophilus TaxID=1781167 RepID=A0A4Z0C021_9BURK|nr:response regulator [Ramlibacter rhizophilus]TFZ04863.1 hybrid sensor histidine kinase/response regulator [Ramlibacter rhizophilus]